MAEIAIRSIKVGRRHRKDVGDISALCESIERQGLLQPIGITKAKQLVFGERRLRACEKLGLKTIEARIVDVTSIVEGEFDENECRKGFTVSERVAIADAVADEIGSRQGQRTDKGELVVNSPQVPSGTKTRDIAAEKAGLSTNEYRNAKKVVENGTTELVEAMDRGELAVSRAAKIAEMPKDEQRVTPPTGNDEWYTPEKFIESAREAMGSIDLDPASCKRAQETVKAGKHYTVDDDGLSKKWAGNVWLNPPYSKGSIEPFVIKLASHIDNGDVKQAVLLVNNATDTVWFQDVASMASVLCLPQGRISFIGANGQKGDAPKYAQVFLYFGNRISAFDKAFRSIGLCWRPLIK